MTVNKYIRMSRDPRRLLLVLALSLAGVLLSHSVLSADGPNTCPNGQGPGGNISLDMLYYDYTDSNFSIIKHDCATILEIDEGLSVAHDLQPGGRFGIYFRDSLVNNRYTHAAVMFEKDDPVVFTVTAGDVEVNGGTVNGFDLLRGLTPTIGNSTTERLGGYHVRYGHGRSTFHLTNFQRAVWVPSGTIDRDVDIPITIALKSGTLTNGQKVAPFEMEGIIRVRNNDDLPASDVMISRTTLEAKEGQTVRYSVMLKEHPTEDVVVTPTASSTPAGLVYSVSPSTLTFTPENAHQVQAVTVRLANNDGNVVDDSATITHQAETLSGRQLSVNSVAVNIADVAEASLNVASLKMTPPTLMLHELGTTETIYLQLVSEPAEPVHVDIGITPVPVLGSTLVSRSTLDLTFTAQNWDKPQEVSLTGKLEHRSVEDCADTPFAVTFSSPTHQLVGTTRLEGIVVDASKMDAVSTPQVQRPLRYDQRHCQVIVSETMLSLPEQGQTSYTVQLARDPGISKSLRISSSNGDYIQVKQASDAAFAGQTTLHFSSGADGTWNTPQTVMVKAVAGVGRFLKRQGGPLTSQQALTDATFSGAELTHSFVTTHSWFMIENKSVFAIIDVDYKLSITSAPSQVAEGATASYSVALPGNPGKETTLVKIKSMNPNKIKLSDGSGGYENSVTLTFTGDNWMTPQTVAIQAQQDADGDDDTVELEHRTSRQLGGCCAVERLSVVVQDDD